jgi:hypothetical protein
LELLTGFRFYKIFYAYFLIVKKCAIKKNKMKIFSILKIDDECSVIHYPLGGLRLDPRAVSTNQSGVTNTPLDGVSVILIEVQIF